MTRGVGGGASGRRGGDGRDPPARRAPGAHGAPWGSRGPGRPQGREALPPPASRGWAANCARSERERVSGDRSPGMDAGTAGSPALRVRRALRPVGRTVSLSGGGQSLRALGCTRQRVTRASRGNAAGGAPPRRERGRATGLPAGPATAPMPGRCRSGLPRGRSGPRGGGRGRLPARRVPWGPRRGPSRRSPTSRTGIDDPRRSTRRDVAADASGERGACNERGTSR